MMHMAKMIKTNTKIPTFPKPITFAKKFSTSPLKNKITPSTSFKLNKCAPVQKFRPFSLRGKNLLLKKNPQFRSHRHFSTPTHENPRILIAGSNGQIGTALIEEFRKIYGKNNVIASDIRIPKEADGPFQFLDVTNEHNYHQIVVENKINWVVHLSSILSAVGETNPQLALHLNVNGLHSALNVAKTHNLRIFIPSSIAAFGPETNLENVENFTVQRPKTIYGVTKVYTELLGDYYRVKYGVDFRCLRFPGIISSGTLPGGGTTDYAVEIFYDALKHGRYDNCFLKEDSMLPMMHMDDCISATKKFLQVDPASLSTRTYNVTGMSFTPRELTSGIQKYMPDFQLNCKPDFRQKIADAWPRRFDDSMARNDWGWSHQFSMDDIIKRMLMEISEKMKKEDPNVQLHPFKI